MADNKRDYYEVLGVQRGASADEVKRAYRKLAKECHPDLHPDDPSAEAKFKEINEAYEVLSDDQKRARYDQYGHAGVDPNFGADAGFGGFDGFGDLGSIFESFFGGGRTSQRSGPMRGESVRTSVTITFEEAAFGCKKTVNVSRIENCPDCGGSGAAPGTQAETCANCHGTGQVRNQRRTPLGIVTTTDTCPVCHGRGKTVANPCKSCGGEGRIRRSRSIELNIPAGIDDGQTIQLGGEGNMGRNGGGAGDLLVTVRVRKHDLFTREGFAVHYNMSVTFAQAALGAELEVPTLDGKVTYTLPEGTQTGSTFRLRGKGIPYLNSQGRGDQYVHVTVQTPKNLTSQQKELLKQFAELRGEKAGGGEKKRGFFDKKKK